MRLGVSQVSQPVAQVWSKLIELRDQGLIRDLACTVTADGAIFHREWSLASQLEVPWVCQILALDN